MNIENSPSKVAKLIFAAAFLYALAGPLASLQADQITNVTASASSFYETANERYPIYAVNGAGLSGDAHTNGYVQVHWLSKTASPIDGEYFIIDLKKNYRLDTTNTLQVWNYNQATYPDIGIRAATFSYSLDSLIFTIIAGVTTDATNFPTTTFDPATGLNTYSNYDTVNFNANVTVRYIKITVNGGQSVGNYGYAGYVGLSEVQAFGTFVSDPIGFLGAQITVSNATASSIFGAAYSATNLINGSGLSGLAHDTVIENMWFTASGDNNVTNAYVDFDFWVSKSIGAVRIWNLNYTANDRAMRTVDILVSDDPTFTSGVITNYNDIELLNSPQANGYDNPQIIDMKRVQGRYVRISNMGNSNPNWDSAPFNIGLSEVQFFLATPLAGTIFTFH